MRLYGSGSVDTVIAPVSRFSDYIGTGIAQ